MNEKNNGIGYGVIALFVILWLSVAFSARNKSHKDVVEQEIDFQDTCSSTQSSFPSQVLYNSSPQPNFAAFQKALRDNGVYEKLNNSTPQSDDPLGRIIQQALQEFCQDNPQVLQRYMNLNRSSRYDQGYSAGYSDAMEEMEGRVEELEERIKAMDQ